jgi:ankyrin repeat protein
VDFYEILESKNIDALKQFIIKHGPNYVLDGQSILMMAVRAGNFDVVKILLENGAKVNWEDKLSRNPLLVSSFFGYAEIVELLLKYGAKRIEDALKRAENGWDNNRQEEVTKIIKTHLSKISKN